MKRSTESMLRPVRERWAAFCFCTC